MRNTSGCFYYFLTGLTSGRDRCRDQCRNVRGQGKSMVVLGLLEKLRHSNERSIKFESLYQE